MPGGGVQVGHGGEVAVEVGSGALQLGETLALEIRIILLCDLAIRHNTLDQSEVSIMAS